MRAEEETHQRHECPGLASEAQNKDCSHCNWIYKKKKKKNVSLMVKTSLVSLVCCLNRTNFTSLGSYNFVLWHEQTKRAVTCTNTHFHTCTDKQISWGRTRTWTGHIFDTWSQQSFHHAVHECTHTHFKHPLKHPFYNSWYNFLWTDLHPQHM